MFILGLVLANKRFVGSSWFAVGVVDIIAVVVAAVVDDVVVVVNIVVVAMLVVTDNIISSCGV